QAESALVRERLCDQGLLAQQPRGGWWRRGQLALAVGRGRTYACGRSKSGFTTSGRPCGRSGRSGGAARSGRVTSGRIAAGRTDPWACRIVTTVRILAMAAAETLSGASILPVITMRSL